MLQYNNHGDWRCLIGGTDSIQRRGDAGAGCFEDAGGVVEVAGWVEAGVGVGAGNWLISRGFVGVGEGVLIRREAGEEDMIVDYIW
jgi:hypothetical protein